MAVEDVGSGLALTYAQPTAGTHGSTWFSAVLVDGGDAGRTTERTPVLLSPDILKITPHTHTHHHTHTHTHTQSHTHTHTHTEYILFVVAPLSTHRQTHTQTHTHTHRADCSLWSVLPVPSIGLRGRRTTQKYNTPFSHVTAFRLISSVK